MIFMHADGFDIVLMMLGFVGCVGDGLTMPVAMFVSSRLINHIGSIFISHDPHLLIHNINRDALFLCFVGAGAWCLCFLEGYCWTRTAERQATRMRARYLKAVLRQDVGYFDLNVTSTSEVITSVSSDCPVIQDCISEKVPNFLSNVTAMISNYLLAFFMEWRLAIVGFPFVVLLVIPGFMYGRILMGLARKIREEYNRAGIIAEQAISSIRTVHAFVVENKTLADFSAALEGSVKVGLKQGLAKGLAIGCNAVVFVVWAFNSWYGSRLVMYHGAQGDL
ncbi:ABC transporter B member 15, variant 2 [Ancistrocladus abbreviatus]